VAGFIVWPIKNLCHLSFFFKNHIQNQNKSRRTKEFFFSQVLFTKKAV